MRTKQPVRAKLDHFMHRDCVESEALERIAPLRAEHKQPNNITGAQQTSGAKVRPEGKGRSAWPSESPTSVFEPGVAPTSPLTLPVAVAEPADAARTQLCAAPEVSRRQSHRPSARQGTEESAL